MVLARVSPSLELLPTHENQTEPAGFPTSSHTYHQCLQRWPAPTHLLGWGEKEFQINWRGREVARYGKLGIKGNIKSPAPRVKSCPSWAGPRSQSQKPQRAQPRAAAHRPRASEVGTRQGDESLKPRPNPQGQSTRARSKQVMTGEAQDRGWIQGRNREAKTEQSWREAEEIKCQTTRRQGIRSVVC